MESLLAEEDDLFLVGSSWTVCDMKTHNESSTETEAQIVWWTNVVSLPIIALVGIACNLLNIIILTNNKAARRIPSWNLLLALAVCDSMFLVFATLEVTPTSIQFLVESSVFNAIHSYTAVYIRTIASTLYKASVLIVVSFNVERYICVCYPLTSHRLCTTRNSRRAILISFVISFLCSLQWPIVYETTQCWDNDQDRYFYMITMSEDPTLQMYYRFMDYLSLIGFNMCPIVLLSALNIRLIITLRKVVDRDLVRRGLQNGEADRRESLIPDSGLTQDPEANMRQGQKFNANAMLFAVVILLFICVGPQAPARLLYECYDHYDTTAIIYQCISQQMVFLNAALNFCVYCLVSRRYRSLLKQSVKKLFGEALNQRFSLILNVWSKSSSTPAATVLDDQLKYDLIYQNSYT
uniref:G_PROTEIN_RECEP_F1_2 domain-containing protein n=1 Tax=Steinernema glaseri TaxID=37863 RepID=A0A1I7YLD9_9BILA